MDIQEMVENRIRELRAGDELPAAREDDLGGSLDDGQSGKPATSHRIDYDRRKPGEHRVSPSGVAVFSDLVDKKLAEVASRVLDISERISNDYGRLEQDLLKSRLEVLQSAETVLDLTMSLRRQCRQLLAGPPVTRTGAGGIASSTSSACFDHEASGEDDSRTSMRAMGVADLFRRT